MSQDALPAPVLDLVARSLASMEQIESLLLLHRTAGTAWRPADVARELRAEPRVAAAALAALAAEGLVRRGPGRDGVAAGVHDASDSFEYAPATTTLAETVDQLAVAYNTRPVTLIKALYSRPPKAVTSFADAFRIR